MLHIFRRKYGIGKGWFVNDARLKRLLCLRTLGRRDEWENVVYPGMRESITGALLAAQDHMEPRQNCFELYGADFILTEDLKPWLIEINSSPAMSATTSVTARMCPQCLEDIIKGLTFLFFFFFIIAIILSLFTFSRLSESLKQSHSCKITLNKNIYLTC